MFLFQSEKDAQIIIKNNKSEETTKILNHDTTVSDQLLNVSTKSRSNSVDYPLYTAITSSPSSFSPTHRQINENISRKNLNTIVEAILHVEGKPLDDLQQHSNNFNVKSPSISSTSSAPPKKRKYTTSSLTLEDELQVKQLHQQISPTKCEQNSNATNSDPHSTSNNDNNSASSSSSAASIGFLVTSSLS